MVACLFVKIDGRKLGRSRLRTQKRPDVPACRLHVAYSVTRLEVNFFTADVFTDIITWLFPWCPENSEF